MRLKPISNVREARGRTAFLMKAALLTTVVVTTASCGNGGVSDEEMKTARAVFAALATAYPTIEAAQKTQTAEEWPVFNGVPTVTVTIEGETATFTGGYCRARREGENTEIIVVSGDEDWIQRPATSGEGIELTASSPYDLDGFRIQVQVGDRSFHFDHQLVRSLEDRQTALAVSQDLRGGTFKGNARAFADETTFVSISGSFVCNSDKDVPPPALTPAHTPGPSPSPSGTQTITMSDFFFTDASGHKNPTISVPVGQSLTFDIINNGVAIHSLHVANASGQYATPFCTTGGTDPCSDPPAVTPGSTARLTVTFAASGTYEFRCDFHPTQMTGKFVAK